MDEFTEEQLDCTVTVEMGVENECYPAELRVCADNHFCLDDNHPVIYVG